MTKKANEAHKESERIWIAIFGFFLTILFGLTTVFFHMTSTGIQKSANTVSIINGFNQPHVARAIVKLEEMLSQTPQTWPEFREALNETSPLKNQLLAASVCMSSKLCLEAETKEIICLRSRLYSEIVYGLAQENFGKTLEKEPAIARLMLQCEQFKKTDTGG